MPDISFPNTPNPPASQMKRERLVNSNFTITNADGIIWVDASAGNIAGVFDDPTPMTGQRFTIKRIDSSSNTVSLTATNSTIDGNATFVMRGTDRQSYDFVAANGMYGIANSYNEAKQQVEENTFAATPRLRVNKTSSMTLTTTFQTLSFDGTSPYNLNSFKTLTGQTNPSVYYDSATSLIKFNANRDKNYNFFISTSITSSQLLTTLNLGSASLRIRLMIPAPTPVTFPLPDFGGYLDVAAVNLTGQRNDQQPIAVFANQLVRDYGVAVQVCLSNSVVGTVTLNGADLIIFPIS